MADDHKTGEDSALAIAPQSDDPWVSLNGAIELSGRVKTTILRAALDGKIRHQRFAGRRLYHRDDVLALKTLKTRDDDDDDD